MKGEIIAHYVVEYYQRKGYGKLLFVSCAKFFAKNKVKQMHLWVHQENPAILFYESQGGGRMMCVSIIWTTKM